MAKLEFELVTPGSAVRCNTDCAVELGRPVYIRNELDWLQSPVTKYFFSYNPV